MDLHTAAVTSTFLSSKMSLEEFDEGLGGSESFEPQPQRTAANTRIISHEYLLFIMLLHKSYSFLYSLITPRSSFLTFLRIHPPHGPFQLCLGDVEITQCAVVVDPGLGQQGDGIENIGLR